LSKRSLGAINQHSSSHLELSQNVQRSRAKASNEYSVTIEAYGNDMKMGEVIENYAKESEKTINSLSEEVKKTKR